MNNEISYNIGDSPDLLASSVPTLLPPPLTLPGDSSYPPSSLPSPPSSCPSTSPLSSSLPPFLTQHDESPKRGGGGRAWWKSSHSTTASEHFLRRLKLAREEGILIEGEEEEEKGSKEEQKEREEDLEALTEMEQREGRENKDKDNFHTCTKTTTTNCKSTIEKKLGGMGEQAGLELKAEKEEDIDVLCEQDDQHIRKLCEKVTETRNDGKQFGWTKEVYRLRVLVPKSSVARLIGRRGCSVQAIQHSSNVKIELERRIRPFQKRCCILTGEFPNLRRALSSIANRIRATVGATVVSTPIMTSSGSSTPAPTPSLLPFSGISGPYLSLAPLPPLPRAVPPGFLARPADVDISSPRDVTCSPPVYMPPSPAYPHSSINRDNVATDAFYLPLPYTMNASNPHTSSPPPPSHLTPSTSSSPPLSSLPTTFTAHSSPPHFRYAPTGPQPQDDVAASEAELFCALGRLLLELYLHPTIPVPPQCPVPPPAVSRPWLAARRPGRPRPGL